MFDSFVRQRHGTLYSIDVTSECLQTARRACSSATHLVFNDSVAALHALARGFKAPIDLLYLDSFDLDPAYPMPGAIHHALELMAASPPVGAGTIVGIDDYEVESVSGGKGLIVDQFLSTIRAEVLHSGYQKIWRIR